MGTDKLRLSAVGCLGGKATEFNVRITWARSRCHTLNIWGSWFFWLPRSVPLSRIVFVLLWGERRGSTRAAWCRCVLSCSTIIHGQLSHPKPREVQREPSADLHGSEQALRVQHIPVARGWVLLCLALIGKIIAFHSYKEYSFKTRNFQIF